MTTIAPTFNQVVLFDHEHLRFDTASFTWHCGVCGERLMLDGVVIKKLHAENAHGMIRHIVETQVNPWLREHENCGDKRSFAA